MRDHREERLRILVVDDDRAVREMLPVFLIESYAPGPAPVIETVGSAAEVAARLARTSPRERLVVLSDHNLKTATNGIDVLAEVQRARPDAIRILFSGHAREEIPGLNEADLHGFLEKPFSLDEIVQPFRAIVDRLASPRAGTIRAPADAPSTGSSPRASAAGKLAPAEVMAALVKAATRGEGARAQTLYEEARRRGQGEEANRETNNFLTWQNRVLEMVATNAPLKETLTVLTRSVDKQAPGMRASVLLVGEGGTPVVYGATPGLQEAHKEGWSTSIVTPDGRVLGAFALDCRERRAPTDRELQLIDLGANLARAAINSDRDHHELRDARERSDQVAADYRALAAEMAAERNKFHLLLMQSPSAINILEGPEHRFTFVNPKTRDINGRDPSELLGKTVAKAVPEIVAQGFIKLLDGVYSTGEPVFISEAPVTFQRAGKPDERFLDFSYQAYRGADGRIAGVTALAN
ncbi:MAG TPA: PAS domain-containing protein, partial [Candidatus Thermoplasmatota archaeon]|nr:PAS domain-containing protein [Candidatus Thermoplasmatota archaeon]